MKKHIIIDDNGITGYGAVEETDGIYAVSFEIKHISQNPNITGISAYLINGSHTFELGKIRQMGGGVSLRRLYERENFFDFDFDLPSKIKFRIQLGETVEVAQNAKKEVERKDGLKKALSKYLRQYDIFCDKSYPDVVWYRVHDEQILIKDNFSKRIFENYAVLDILHKLKHYLIGFGKDGALYYAFPARFGVESNPFDETFSKPKWLAVYGQAEKFGNFGYYVLKAESA